MLTTPIAIAEPSRTTPVRAEVDVLVVGGGLAGLFLGAKGAGSHGPGLGPVRVVDRPRMVLIGRIPVKPGQP